MKKKLNMIYALKDNQLVHIDNVERGLACGCVCPGCKGTLIARQGKQMIHHFAHTSAECSYGYQTSLHLLAKDILLECRGLYLPPVNSILGQMHDWTYLDIDNVYLEQADKKNNIIPDVVIEAKGKKLYLEIFVTHRVDSNKWFKLRKADISTIEIDLSKLDRDIDKNTLYDIIQGKSDNKYWIYNSPQLKQNEYILNELCSIPKPSNTSLSEVYCPINKRKHRTGKYFAYLYEDCRHCIFNAAIKPEFIKLHDIESDVEFECEYNDMSEEEYLPYLLTTKGSNCYCLGKYLVADECDLDADRFELIKKYIKHINIAKRFMGQKRCPTCGGYMQDQVNTQTR